MPTLGLVEENQPKRYIHAKRLIKKMKKILIFLVIFIHLAAGCSKEEPLLVKDYFIGMPINECPSNNSTVNRWVSDGIIHCLLQPTTYAGFKSSSFEIEIYDGLIHAVKLVIRPEQNSMISSALISKYGNPISTIPSIQEWQRGSQVLFLFSGGIESQIRLIDRENQKKHQDRLNSSRAKDL